MTEHPSVQGRRPPTTNHRDGLCGTASPPPFSRYAVVPLNLSLSRLGIRISHDGRGHGPSIKKRPHSTFAADQDCSVTDTLVSDWLDEIYPCKRRRRYSDTAIDMTTPHLIEEVVTEGCKDIQNRRGRPSSEPTMGAGDDDCFMQQMTPPTTRCPCPSSQQAGDTSTSRARSASRGAGSTRGRGDSVSLVESEHYRRINLSLKNGIRLRKFGSPFPAVIQALVEPLTANLPPLVPTDEDRIGVEDIQSRNDDEARPMEPSVRSAFDGILFPKPRNNEHLKRVDNMPMKRSVVPFRLTQEQLQEVLQKLPLRERETERLHSRISIPIPDALYGYAYRGLPDELQAIRHRVLGDSEVVNGSDLTLPFLVVECKGDGGSMWCCTNQCLGGAASCVHVGERLNAELRAVGCPASFNSAVFAITTNSEHANLFVCWRHAAGEGGEGDRLDDTTMTAAYYMQRIGCYALQDMEHFLRLKRCVRMIIEWGMGKRMDEIEEVLRLAGTRKRKDREGENLEEDCRG